MKSLLDLGFRVQGLGLGFSGLAFRVLGLGLSLGPRATTDSGKCLETIGSAAPGMTWSCSRAPLPLSGLFRV